MQIEYSNTALKDLKKLPTKVVLAIMRKLDTYAETGAGDVKKLSNRDEYRLRHGGYRALFVIDSGILVVRVAKRDRVYR